MNVMNMESVAGRTPYRQMHARSGELRTAADRALLSRFWRFAGRHHRRLGLFVALSVLSALLAVATPILAGKVVDQIFGGGTPAIVVGLAAIIAVVALGEAAVSSSGARMSSCWPAAAATPSCTRRNSAAGKTRTTSRREVAVNRLPVVR